MFVELDVRDVGVIAHASIPFDKGMTAITGETGAGKTMLLAGVGLILGEQGDPHLVRAGATSSEVSAILHVEAESAAHAAADRAGAHLDDGDLIVTRSVPREGRTRAFLGGRAVPRAVLGEVLGDQIVVHGQSTQMRLRSPAQQRALLDHFAGPAHATQLQRYRGTYTEVEAMSRRLADLRAAAAARGERREMLELELAEFDKTEPLDGEDAQLDEIIARLSNAEDLRAAAEAAHAALVGESEDPAGLPGAEALVAEAGRSLEHAAGIDPQLQEVSSSLRTIGYLMTDASQALASYAAGLDADPARLEQLLERRAELGTLMRAHGPALADVMNWAVAARRELDELAGAQDEIPRLEERLATARAELQRQAGAISAGRAKAATKLAVQVGRELGALAMAGAEVRVEITPLAELGPTGGDNIEMMLRTHAAAPFRPLAKAASGGELSRVMLALELCLAGTLDERPTLIFDEIDAGVGGKAAQEIGRRLARLAASTQVVVVTHLAQVAAFADTHLVVAKTVSAKQAASQVVAVDGDDRLVELARMLSGQADSATAHSHARELLELARGAR